MKALIRNEGETVTEDMDIQGINWNTGAPLTDVAWCGGRYTLVTNYTAPASEGEEPTFDVPEENITVTDDTVVIDGKEYTKEELRALLGE